MTAAAAGPTVSVLTATYNSADLIGATIRSILAQTFTDFEFIIVDDASTDETAAVVRAFDDPRIRLYVNDRNLGISENRNRGLSLCRGRYIACSDQDDLSLPERLEKQVAFLDAHPQAVLVATEGDILRDGVVEEEEPLGLPSHLLHWHLMTKSPIWHSSIMMRRDVLAEHGIVYRRQFPYAEDYDLYHELMRVGELHVLPDKLLHYRYYGGNASLVKKREMTDSGCRFLLEQWRRYIGDTVSLGDIRSVWSMMTEGHPAASVQELQRVGDCYQRLLRSYLERHGDRLGPQRSEDIRRMAGEHWLRAVFRSSKKLGPKALPAYRRYPAIATPPMPRLNALRAGLQGLITPR